MAGKGHAILRAASIPHQFRQITGIRRSFRFGHVARIWERTLLARMRSVIP